MDPTTGQRIGDESHVSFTLDADGAFGPFVARSGAHYEWLLSAPDSPTPQAPAGSARARASRLTAALWAAGAALYLAVLVIAMRLLDRGEGGQAWLAWLPQLAAVAIMASKSASLRVSRSDAL